MVIDLQAFVSLEKTLAATLWKAASGTTAMIGMIDPLCAEGRFGEAVEIAAQLDLGFAAQTNKVEELLVSDYLFGASLADTGSTDIPAIIHSAMEQLDLFLKEEATPLLQMSAVQLIARRRGVMKVECTPVEAYIEEQCACGCLEWAEGRVLKAADPGYMAAISQALNGTGKKVVDIAANLTTGKVINYGFLAQANKVGIERYQVQEILDDRTCPVCEIMHGRTFEVRPQLKRLGQALASKDLATIKKLTPWPSQKKSEVAALSQKSDEELQGMGLGSPPYHPGCRGVLHKIGTVKPLQPSLDALANSIFSGL